MSATRVSPAPAPPSRPPRQRRVARHLAGRIGAYVTVCVLAMFFALPLTWVITASFQTDPDLSVNLSHPTLANVDHLIHDSAALSSLGVSVLLAIGTALLVLVCGSMAAYALSRGRVPGRDALLYVLLLLSSVVTGTAAMVPVFLLAFQLGLIDQQTGVILVMTGGYLPSVIFIIKDFLDTLPRSYEESARVFGAGRGRVLRDIVIPLARPGLATAAVWTIVMSWGNFLTPFILISSQSKQPASVVLYSFYTTAGQPDLRALSVFSLVYALPVVIMYLVLNKRYGFSFHGGVKS